MPKRKNNGDDSLDNRSVKNTRVEQFLENDVEMGHELKVLAPLSAVEPHISAFQAAISSADFVGLKAATSVSPIQYMEQVLYKNENDENPLMLAAHNGNVDMFMAVASLYPKAMLYKKLKENDKFAKSVLMHANTPAMLKCIIQFYKKENINIHNSVLVLILKNISINESALIFDLAHLSDLPKALFKSAVNEPSVIRKLISARIEPVNQFTDHSILHSAIKALCKKIEELEVSYADLGSFNLSEMQKQKDSEAVQEYINMIFSLLHTPVDTSLLEDEIGKKKSILLRLLDAATKFRSEAFAKGFPALMNLIMQKDPNLFFSIPDGGEVSINQPINTKIGLYLFEAINHSIDKLMLISHPEVDDLKKTIGKILGVNEDKSLKQGSPALCILSKEFINLMMDKLGCIDSKFVATIMHELNTNFASFLYLVQNFNLALVYNKTTINSPDMAFLMKCSQLIEKSCLKLKELDPITKKEHSEAVSREVDFFFYTLKKHINGMITVLHELVYNGLLPIAENGERQLAPLDNIMKSTVVEPLEQYPEGLYNTLNDTFDGNQGPAAIVFSYLLTDHKLSRQAEKDAKAVPDSGASSGALMGLS